MNNRAIITLGLSALALTGAVASGFATPGAAAYAGNHAEAKAATQAGAEAGAATDAYARHRYADAIGHAEAAVGLAPRLAAYRMLLGQSYLMAGRFASARDAFSDTLALDAANGKAALDLALAQIATGDPIAARKTLDVHADVIPVADRGLAIALTGDTASAVVLLVDAVRSPAADAKTRQNLALSFALAGRWQDARTVAAVDLAPEELDQRLMQWMTFSKPVAASDQVASLLGVKAVADAGQPVTLALNAPASPVTTAAAVADPLAPFADPAPVVAAADPAPVTAAPDPVLAPASVAASDPAPVAAAVAVARVTFAPRKEVVQAVPVAAPVAVAMVKPSAPKPAVAKSPPRTLAKGNFYVQLGAFDNAAVARDAWSRATRRYAGFAGQTPQGMSVTAKAGSFYRLTVGGFARADAISLCGGYRSKGGTCFVRSGDGDQVALWARGPQVASR